MTTLDAITERHSVRSFLETPIPDEILFSLEALIADCNEKAGLHIQLIQNEPTAFNSIKAHYGKFRNVQNYVALIGSSHPGLEGKCGYYGEKIALEAQKLGLNTCWVAGTYKKVPKAMDILPGEKLVCVIAIGYGETEGNAHVSKDAKKVYRCPDEAPEWFMKGVEAALLAPTAMNQQKFMFRLHDSNCVKASAGIGPWTNLDLGIVMYHFEIGAGRNNFIWG